MVRHEAAEALGAIADTQCIELLRKVRVRCLSMLRADSMLRLSAQQLHRAAAQGALEHCGKLGIMLPKHVVHRAAAQGTCAVRVARKVVCRLVACSASSCCARWAGQLWEVGACAAEARSASRCV